jgi:hypothetical protein
MQMPRDVVPPVTQTMRQVLLLVTVISAVPEYDEPLKFLPMT